MCILHNTYPKPSPICYGATPFPYAALCLWLRTLPLGEILSK